MVTFYSHFDREKGGQENSKLLVHHLLETADAAKHYVLAVPDSVEHRNELARLMHWIGLAHDFGKYTSFFQDYLQNGRDHGDKKNHSLISALWCMYVLEEKWTCPDPDRFTAMLLAFSCIRSHHGNLMDISEELRHFLQFQRPDLRDMMNVSHRRALKVLFDSQVPDIAGQAEAIQTEWRQNNINFPDIGDFQKNLVDKNSAFWKTFRMASMSFDMQRRKKNLEMFQRHLYLLFSSLIDADKRGAASIDMVRPRLEIPAYSVQRYKQHADFGRVDSGLADLRERLYQQLHKQAETLPLQQHFFTLTAPTGSGKTLAAFNFALRLRQRIEAASGVPPRIIYALPFTSIIDQNYEVFEKVLSEGDGKISADILLKHHHLADFSSEDFAGGENYPLDKLMLLVESWESEIVVTTFVQLFETLIGRRNKMLKKYHNLYSAILLLDEVQNIPVEYWGLVRRVLSDLAEHAGCTIVLMTATQPLIFPPEQTVELVVEPDRLFAGLDRVNFVYQSEKQTLDQFVSRIKDGLGDKSTAVILNTIRSSLEVYKMLSGVKPHELFYLSTNIIPKHRQERIRQIQKKLCNKEPVLLVSTQVIEAGIDFDFDIIYRDMAPIDSIVQAAGRANRNAVGDKGEVRVVSLVDDQGKNFADWIYGSGHLWVAEGLLQKLRYLSEEDFYAVVQKNYESLVQITDQSAGDGIYDDWRRHGDFEALDRFQLIQNRPNYVGVFLPVDEEGEKVWKEYQQRVATEKNLSKRRTAYLELRSEFKKYVLSIPIKLTKKHFWDYCFGDMKKIGYAIPESLKDWYDVATGFVRNGNDRTMIF